MLENQGQDSGGSSWGLGGRKTSLKEDQSFSVVMSPAQGTC